MQPRASTASPTLLCRWRPQADKVLLLPPCTATCCTAGSRLKMATSRCPTSLTQTRTTTPTPVLKPWLSRRCWLPTAHHCPVVAPCAPVRCGQRASGARESSATCPACKAHAWGWGTKLLMCSSYMLLACLSPNPGLAATVILGLAAIPPLQRALPGNGPLLLRDRRAR